MWVSWKSVMSLVGMQNFTHFGESWFLINLNMHLPYDPTASILGFCSRKMKTVFTHTKKSVP